MGSWAGANIEPAPTWQPKLEMFLMKEESSIFAVNTPISIGDMIEIGDNFNSENS